MDDGPGIMVAFGQAPAHGSDRDEWHRWYEDEHIAKRLDVPGIDSVTRYRDHDDADHFAAVYELSSLAALRSDAYRGLKEERSDDERAIPAGSAPVDRRVYREVGWEARKAGYVPGTAPVLLMVGMSMEPGHLDEMVEWYEQEHNPLLLKLDGWQRVRRFTKVEGEGSEHLALHEIASHTVFDDPMKQAAQTPWRDKVIAQRASHERVIYDRWRTFSGRSRNSNDQGNDA